MIRIWSVDVDNDEKTMISVDVDNDEKEMKTTMRRQ